MSDGEVLSLQEQLRKKAFKPRQQVGIYDPMEDAGHRDVIYLKDVLEVVKQHCVCKEELQKLTQDFRELSENPNIYCNNCKDRSAENVVKWVLKRLRCRRKVNK